MIDTKTKMIFIMNLFLFLTLTVVNIMWFNFVKKEANSAGFLRKQIVTELEKNLSMPNIKMALREITLRNEYLSKFFIEKESLVGFIKLIESKAEDAGLNIEMQLAKNDRVTSGKDGAGDDLYGTISLVFKVFGPENSVVKFMRSVENLPYHIQTNSMKFDISNVSNQKQMSLNMSITAITN